MPLTVAACLSGAAQEVRRIMAEVDREGTGTIEFPEFLSISASAPRRRSPPSELQTALI